MTPQDKVAEDIKNFGWHVVKVFDENGNLPNFAYSIGLFESYKHPEVIMFGLDLSVLHQFINNVGDKIKKGKTFEPNVSYDDFVDDYESQFIVVNKEYYDEHLGQAIKYYGGNNFPTIQFVWTDKTNLFPWQKECNEEVKKLQPLLNS